MQLHHREFYRSSSPQKKEPPFLPEGRFHDGLDDAVNTGALIKKLELNPEYEITKYALPESDEHLSCTIGDLFEGLQLKVG